MTKINDLNDLKDYLTKWALQLEKFDTQDYNTILNVSQDYLYNNLDTIDKEYQKRKTQKETLQSIINLISEVEKWEN